EVFRPLSSIMSSITDIKCVLSQKAFDAFCEKFHIPEEVHPVLPSRGDTMHERPAGKIGLYTRFFDFANFRLPLSTFLVDILRHFRINISQLSVIEAAKNDHFFWVDDFACPALFTWHTAKNMTRDPAPIAADFNAQDYATLVAHPSPFRKFPEEFMVDMDIFAFIHTPDPTKVKVVERKRIEDEPLLLETTIGRTVPLLPVAPDRAESEREASVDKFFDEGGSGNQMEQEDSAGGGQAANIQPISEAVDAVVEDVAPVQPKHQRKRKIMVVDAGESSHPPKRLKEDHGTPSGAFVGGKSMSAVQRLLARAVLNAEVRGGAIPTLPFMTSFVPATLEREGEDHTDSVAEPNLRTVSAPQWFVISLDSSHHSGANVAEAKVDSLVRSSVPVMTVVTTVTSTVDLALIAKEKPMKPSPLFAGSSSAGGTDPTTSGFTDLTGSDFLVGGIRTVIKPDSDLQKTYFFASVRGMEHDQLFTEFNVEASRQMSLSVEVRIRAEYNVKERRRLICA
ncbi:hypothetical protein Tco_0286030, partial [Tanacetum coccineum]